MKKKILDDFIEYEKKQFDCDIRVKPSDKPDTFASIFGASFLNDCVEKVNAFDHNLRYENISIDVKFTIDNEMNVVYSNNFGLAA